MNTFTFNTVDPTLTSTVSRSFKNGPPEQYNLGKKCRHASTRDYTSRVACCVLSTCTLCALIERWRVQRWARVRGFVDGSWLSTWSRPS